VFIAVLLDHATVVDLLLSSGGDVDVPVVCAQAPWRAWPRSLECESEGDALCV
jgi:hypothetical protein